MIRPPEVLALGPDTDEPTRTATLRKAVGDVARQQVELGVDVISDGEFGKESWFTYVMRRLDGLTTTRSVRFFKRVERSSTCPTVNHDAAGSYCPRYFTS